MEPRGVPAATCRYLSIPADPREPLRSTCGAPWTYAEHRGAPGVPMEPCRVPAATRRYLSIPADPRGAPRSPQSTRRVLEEPHRASRSTCSDPQVLTGTYLFGITFTEVSDQVKSIQTSLFTTFR